MTGIGDYIDSMGLDDGLKQLHLTQNEAVLMDYVLTSPSWDREVIDRLDSNQCWHLREQVGRVILGYNEPVEVDEQDVRMLLLLVPTLFTVGTEEVGFDLKQKLYGILVGPGPEPEEKDEPADSQGPVEIMPGEE